MKQIIGSRGEAIYQAYQLATWSGRSSLFNPLHSARVTAVIRTRTLSIHTPPYGRPLHIQTNRLRGRSQYKLITMHRPHVWLTTYIDRVLQEAISNKVCRQFNQYATLQIVFTMIHWGQFLAHVTKIRLNFTELINLIVGWVVHCCMNAACN